MATIKSYTDISQSKKLAEILPIESADMEYLAIKENGELVGVVPFVKDYSEVEDSAYSHIYDRTSCWSLAALLGVLPRIDIEKEIWFDDTYSYRVKAYIGDGYVGDWFDNPIDACYELIIKLNELNLL